MKNKLIKAIAFGLCFTAAFSFTSCKKDTGAGTTYYVNYDGTGDGSSKNKPIAFEQISAKVQPGDTLLLASGTYEYGS